MMAIDGTAEVSDGIAEIFPTSHRHRPTRDNCPGGLPFAGATEDRCLLVEVQGELCGIHTDWDIALRVTGLGGDPQQTTVWDVMTPHPVRISVDNTLHELTMLMHCHLVRHVPILDEKGEWDCHA
jgi:CBS domain-containing protein